MKPYGPAPRTAAVLIRTAHICAMAVFVGGRVLGAEEASLRRWRILTTLSGGLLLATEASHSRHWVYQGRGLMTLAHVGVLPAGHLTPDLSVAAPIAALVLGSAGSHLPRSVRKWSVRHRRVLQ